MEGATSRAYGDDGGRCVCVCVCVCACVRACVCVYAWVLRPRNAAKCYVCVLTSLERVLGEVKATLGGACQSSIPPVRVGLPLATSWGRCYVRVMPRGPLSVKV